MMGEPIPSLSLAVVTTYMQRWIDLRYVGITLNASFYRGSLIFSISISGIEWVGTQHETRGGPSVVTMSLGGSASLPLNDAVETVCVLFCEGTCLSQVP